MKSKFAKRLIGIFFLISILITCIAAIYVGKNFASDKSSMHEAMIQELPTGWEYEEFGERKEIDQLPTTVQLNEKSESLTLYYRLPEELPQNACLEFISQQTSVEVMIDGRPIYTYGVHSKPPVGKLLGNSRNVIVLPKDVGGKEIAIRLVSPYSPNRYRVGSITLGSRAEILYRFVKSSIGLVIFCMLALFFCLLVLFLAVFFKIKKVEVNSFSIICFALFIFLSTTWIITDSNILQLLTSNFALVYFVSHLNFMLFPVPLLLFLRQTTSYGHRWYSLLCIMFLVGFFVRVGLFFGGVADLESTLFLTHIMMGISAVLPCVLLHKEWRRCRDKTSLMFLVGFVALGLCLIISLIAFFLAPEPNYSIYFCIMLTVMMSAMLYRIISQLESLAKQGIKAQVYQELAYIDVMTNLSSRFAFEEDMRTIQEKPECRTLGLVVFDINKLKYVNDTYGHRAGDGLIKCAATCIREHFAPIGKCYRIGGDEFTVILKDFSEESLERVLEDFQTVVHEAKTGTPENLSIAVGHATGPAEGGKFAHRLFDIADQRMYAEKEKMHQQLDVLSETH